MPNGLTLQNVNGGTLTVQYAGTATGNRVLTLPEVTDTLTNGAPQGRNYLINSNFDRWNYATSQTSNGYGSDDRWNNANAGSTKTHSQVACTDTERTLFNASKFSRTVVTSVAGANNFVYKNQPIEDVTKLAGKTVTLSFWAKADTTKNIWFSTTQRFGTGGTPSADIYGTNLQEISLTSTWQKKTITFTLASMVGKTLGTDGVHTSCTFINFWFDVGSNISTYITGGIQQSGTFDIAEVQLEEGTVATKWSPYFGEFGGELQACQRYLPKFNFTAVDTPLGNGFIYNATTGFISIKLPTTSRVAPTGAVFSSQTLFRWQNVSIIATTTALLAVGYTTEMVEIQGTISGGTAGQGATIRAATSGYIYFTGCEL